ncbi:MAG: glutamate--cysteine ligase [Myxococcales bacterium]|nr:glutamate--cysteine ligase [Myxococcales bacterium]
MGTENEMLGFLSGPSFVGKPVPYYGPRGLNNILEALEANGWAPVREADSIIALTCHDAQVSIEPGAQLEYAARPHSHSADLAKDLRSFLDFIREPSADIGAHWISSGFRMWGELDDVCWVPKFRYNIMRDYLPTRGDLSHEMMKRTATVQVNLDYSSAEDARRKMRAVMSTTSLLTALYANSPVVDGKRSGYQSYRAHIWTRMDPDRCGLLDFVFEDEGNFFERYTEWALDVPLFFVHRDSYLPAGGMTFREFMRDGFEGYKATMDDWGLHLSTLFPDARMKQYLEVRGCDANSFDMTLGLGALCCGFMYNDEACKNAIALTESLSFEQRIDFGDLVNKEGLQARLPGSSITAQELAKELVDISANGLRRIDPSELPFLDPIREVAETGRSHATRLLELWDAHNGSPEKILPLLSYHQ